jgi:putative membrane protein
MNTFTNLLTALVLAGWISAIAILSVQNATLISLKFLVFQSIQLPLGVVLGFSTAVGLIGGAIVPFLWQLSGSQVQTQGNEGEYDDEDF